MMFIIGGDGTHRGANALSSAALKRNYECAFVGIPKTIDNDSSQTIKNIAHCIGLEVVIVFQKKSFRYEWNWSNSGDAGRLQVSQGG